MPVASPAGCVDLFLSCIAIGLCICINFCSSLCYPVMCARPPLPWLDSLEASFSFIPFSKEKEKTQGNMG